MERTLRGLLARVLLSGLRMRMYVAVLGVLAFAGVAWAQPVSQVPVRTADEHLAKGLALYERDQFSQAIAEFRAGYQTSGRPEFLFAMAQAMRRSGDCESALTYYQQFLATKPPAKQVQAARLHIRGCRQDLAGKNGGEGREADGSPAAREGRAGRHERGSGKRRGRRVPAGGSGEDAVHAGESPRALAASGEGSGQPGSQAAADDNASAAPRRPVPQATDANDTRLEASATPRNARPPLAPWYHDMAGDVLLGSGAAGVALGVGLLVASGRAHDSAQAASTYLDYDMHVSRAERYRTWGVVSLASASVMIAGSLYRFYRHAQADEARAISLIPLSGGIVFSYGGEL